MTDIINIINYNDSNFEIFFKKSQNYQFDNPIIIFDLFYYSLYKGNTIIADYYFKIISSKFNTYKLFFQNKIFFKLIKNNSYDGIKWFIENYYSSDDQNFIINDIPNIINLTDIENNNSYIFNNKIIILIYLLEKKLISEQFINNNLLEKIIYFSIIHKNKIIFKKITYYCINFKTKTIKYINNYIKNIYFTFKNFDMLNWINQLNNLFYFKDSFFEYHKFDFFDLQKFNQQLTPQEIIKIINFNDKYNYHNFDIFIFKFSEIFIKTNNLHNLFYISDNYINYDLNDNKKDLMNNYINKQLNIFINDIVIDNNSNIFKNLLKLDNYNFDQLYKYSQINYNKLISCTIINCYKYGNIDILKILFYEFPIIKNRLIYSINDNIYSINDNIYYNSIELFKISKNNYNFKNIDIIQNNKIKIINWLVEINIINKQSDLLQNYINYYILNNPYFQENCDDYLLNITNIKIDIFNDIFTNLLQNKAFLLFENFINYFIEINDKDITFIINRICNFKLIYKFQFDQFIQFYNIINKYNLNEKSSQTDINIFKKSLYYSNILIAQFIKDKLDLNINTLAIDSEKIKDFEFKTIYWLIINNLDIDTNLLDDFFKKTCENKDIINVKILNNMFPDIYKYNVEYKNITEFNEFIIFNYLLNAPINLDMQIINKINYNINRPLNITRTISIEQINTCPICLSLDSNIITKCNHMFCQNCYKEYIFNNNGKRCPICRSDEGLQELKKIKLKHN